MPTCTRHAKTTGRPCRREAAEWPHHSDLPAPVVACASHLTPAEWTACQDARARAAAEHAAIWAAESAAREERSDQARPTTTAVPDVPRLCTGQCVSQATAWGREADSALSLCANCDGFVCLNCGAAEVGGELEFCGQCEEFDASSDELDEARGEEIDTGPEPRTRLTAMVNQLVTVTGATHGYVNARINRAIGVGSRVGVDERVIRRAAWAARDWLDRVLAAQRAAADASPGTSGPGRRGAPARRPEPPELAENAAGARERSLRSDVPGNRRADDAAGECAGLTVTVQLTEHGAERLRRAEVRWGPVGQAVLAGSGDATGHDADAPDIGSGVRAATVDGIARRLTLIVRELGALPLGSFTHVIARATAESGLARQERHMLEQLGKARASRTAAFGQHSENASALEGTAE